MESVAERVAEAAVELNQVVADSSMPKCENYRQYQSLERNKKDICLVSTQQQQAQMRPHRTQIPIEKKFQYQFTRRYPHRLSYPVRTDTVPESVDNHKQLQLQTQQSIKLELIKYPLNRIQHRSLSPIIQQKLRPNMTHINHNNSPERQSYQLKSALNTSSKNIQTAMKIRFADNGQKVKLSVNEFKPDCRLCFGYMDYLKKDTKIVQSNRASSHIPIYF